MMRVLLGCLLVFLLQLAVAPPAASQRRPTTAARPAKPSPTLQQWRVNDTLMLECSRPQATLVLEEYSTKSYTVWGQIALRGSRGSYQVLDTEAYWTLCNAVKSPAGDLFQLSTVDVDADPAQARAKKLKQSERDLGYNTYDVRYQTWTGYLDENLNELPVKQIEPGFLGGEARDGDYYPLPYWLTQEQTRLARTHSLPPAAQLDMYLELSQDTAAYTGRLGPAYRPLLTTLLKAYQTYPLPPATAARLKQAVQSLAVPSPRK